MSWLLNFPQPVCVRVADGHVAAEGSQGAGEARTTSEAGESPSSAALTLLCLFLVIIKARTPFSSCVVRFHSVMG